MHGLLERQGVPVAPLLGWGRASGTGDHSWMMFERVDHDDRTSLSPPALAALGRVLRRVHAIASTPGLEAVVGRQTAPEAMLERVQTRVSALAERVGYPTSDELLCRAQAVIGERAGLRDLRLTHMDLRSENLCFQGDDLVAVLDLSNCTLGDPAAELGRMAAYGTLTRDLLEAYADGEPPDDRLIAAYAVDTYALLGLLGAEEFAEQELVNRGLQGLDDCLRRLRAWTGMSPCRPDTVPHSGQAASTGRSGPNPPALPLGRPRVGYCRCGFKRAGRCRCVRAAVGADG